MLMIFVHIKLAYTPDRRSLELNMTHEVKIVSLSKYTVALFISDSNMERRTKLDVHVYCPGGECGA